MSETPLVIPEIAKQKKINLVWKDDEQPMLLNVKATTGLHSISDFVSTCSFLKKWKICRDLKKEKAQ